MTKYRHLFAIALIGISCSSYALNFRTCMQHMPSLISQQWQTKICTRISNVEAKHGHSRKQLTDTAKSLASKVKQRIQSVANRKS